MSLSVATSPINNRQIAEGQFIADLAGLLQRSGVDPGSGDVGQFEDLLRNSDSFRSRLFSLCTAISHMSDHDLTGEELVELLGKALGTEESGHLPEDLATLFQSSFEAWNNRITDHEDEWPPMKKPAGTVSVMPAPETAVAVRRPNIRTLQEAISVARGGDELAMQGEVIPLYPDANVLALQDLDALLAQIEERVKRMKSQQTSSTSPTELLAPDIREAAFLERHSYLRSKPARPANELIAAPIRIDEPMELPALTYAEPALPKLPAPDQELRLVPRNVVEELAASPPRLVIPDAVRLKTYLALALVICIGLIATPICAVIAYRYMHPLYIYAPATTQPVETPAAPTEDKAPAQHPVRKAKPARSKSAPPAFRVFPAQ